jgi:hypothetical protein
MLQFIKDQSGSPPLPSAVEHDVVPMERIPVYNHCKLTRGVAILVGVPGSAAELANKEAVIMLLEIVVVAAAALPAGVQIVAETPDLQQRNGIVAAIA